MQLRRRQALLAITVGGLVAGTLDLAQACILFGPKIPLAIAGGLLGPQAFRGGTGTYILGILLHFLIAFTAAAAGTLISSHLTHLQEVKAESNRVFELDIYHAVPGKVPALAERFRPASKLQTQHGLQVVGYWIPQDSPVLDLNLALAYSTA